MKATALKIERYRYDIAKSAVLGIQTYGQDNDYPQSVMEIVAASVTGSSCVKRYSDFIFGKGFADKTTYQIAINQDGDTCDHLLQNISRDLAMFGGFAIHVNYNANGLICSLYHVPFEMVRLEKPDDNGHFNKVAIHPDWGKRYTNLRKWKKDDITFINLYDSNTEHIAQQIKEVGGWNEYKGQVFFYSNQGKKVYPLPIFDSSLTDMNTEEGISNITNRNARNNFLPAGMLVDICNTDESEDDNNTTEESVKQFQGDKKALNIMYVQVRSKEEIPTYVKFTGNNYDKEFTVSRDSVKDSIGRSFNQPPILRAENVGSGFGAEIMQQAYNYYNSVTENERLEIERTFVELFKHWKDQIELNFEIQPLTYDVEMTLADKLGDNLTEFMEMVNSALPNSQKRGIAKVLYGLNDDEINAIIPL